MMKTLLRMQNENLDKTLNVENHVNYHNACMKICVKLRLGTHWFQGMATSPS
jgi:hypothetical protein